MLQAMLTYNREAKEVQLAVDRSYTKGEPIEAWCGPQVRIFDMHASIMSTFCNERFVDGVCVCDTAKQAVVAELWDRDGQQPPRQVSRPAPPPTFLPFGSCFSLSAMCRIALR